MALTDSGGTANGGADTSATQVFEISVAGANDPPNVGNDVRTVRLGSTPVTLDVLVNDDGGRVSQATSPDRRLPRVPVPAVSSR